MPLIDTIKDGFNKFLPQKKEAHAVPLATSSGGIGHGLVPFDDEMPISKPRVVFHATQIFFTFIAMCCFASVASFQAKWNIGPSGLSGFAIFVAVTGILLSLFMVLVPVIYDRYDKLVRLARALQEVRVGFILSAAGVAWLLLISFVTTISAFTQKGCKNPDNDPHADLGDDFKARLPGWCRTKKAGAIFFWFAFAAWVASLVVAIMEWRRGTAKVPRPRDPPFRPPENTHDHDDDAASEAYSPIRSNTQRAAGRDEEEPSSPFDDDHRYTAPTSTTAGRPSMDAYGAFADPPPTGYGGNATGISRTMQYADPYAAVRASVQAGSRTTPPSYESGYTGYRS